jgi:hypothetical protein
MKRAILPLLMLLVGVLGGLFGPRLFTQESTTLVSLSTDDQLRVHLVERRGFMTIDRNFEVRLERLTDRSVVTLFRSPDEGRPEGSERVVWSPDGKQFVLVGRHFFVREGVQLPTGESLYLLYDVPSGKLCCNSRQQTDYPGFGLAEVTWLR